MWTPTPNNQMIYIAKELMQIALGSDNVTVNPVTNDQAGLFSPQMFVTNLSLYNWDSYQNMTTPSCNQLPSEHGRSRICLCVNTFWGDSTPDHSDNTPCPSLSIQDATTTYTPSKPIRPGTIVEIVCSPSFKLNGSGIMTCNKTGTWSAPEPVCEASKYMLAPTAYSPFESCHNACAAFRYDATCDFTRFWDNTANDPRLYYNQMQLFWPAVKFNSTYANATETGNYYPLFVRESPSLSFTAIGWLNEGANRPMPICDAKSSQIPRSHRLCQCKVPYYGEGKPTQEMLEVVCPAISGFSNGTIFYDDSDLKVGTIANLICNNGYAMTGAAIMTCNATGQWSRSIPYCEIQNITYHLSSSNQNCDERCELHHPLAVCDFTNFWNVEDPYEIRNRFFLFNDPPPQFEISISNSVANVDDYNPLVKYIPGSYFIGRSLRDLKTANSVNTYFEGWQRGNVQPTCYHRISDTRFYRLCPCRELFWGSINPLYTESLECSDLGNITNGIVAYFPAEARKTGTVARTACQNGFDLVGISTFICMPDRTWSGVLPKCEKSNYNFTISVANQNCDDACAAMGETFECDFTDFWTQASDDFSEIPNRLLFLQSPEVNPLSITAINHVAADGSYPKIHNERGIEGFKKGSTGSDPVCDLAADESTSRMCQCREFDACSSNPCRGTLSTCSKEGAGYFCNCEPGLFGEICEFDRNECISNECDSKKSKCFDNLNGYTCIPFTEVDSSKYEILKSIGALNSHYSSLTVDQTRLLGQDDNFQGLEGIFKEGVEFNEHYIAAITSTIDDMLPFIMSNVDSELRYSLGFTEFDLIKYCSVKNKQSCDWNFKYNHRYGNCYTYNSNESTVVKMERSGVEYGVYLVLDSNSQNALSFTESAGLRMVLHSQSDIPFPENEGFMVNGGYATSYTLRYEKKLLNPKLMTGCTASKKSIDPFYYPTYTLAACHNSQTQSIVEKSCGCSSPHFPSSGQDVLGCGLENKTCVDEVETTMKDIAFTNCQQPCLNEILRIESSRTARLRIFDSQCDSEIDPTCKFEKDMAVLYIYYGTLRVEALIEVRKTSISSILSDFGGLIGLFVGGSVISLIELTFIIGECCRNKIRC